MSNAFFDSGYRAELDADAVSAAPDAADQHLPKRKPKRGKITSKTLSRAAYLQMSAALIWIPQASALAYAVGVIADGGGVAGVAAPAAGVLALGLIRAGLDAAGGRMAFRGARLELTRRRERVAAALAARSPLDAERPSSGLAASLIAEQAEAIVPYLARFQPARLKASAVPLVMFACILPISWVAALILLIAAPLIPLFMALIGWRAQEASERHLAATGGLNAFLLDRLRGLATIRALAAVDATALRLRADALSLRQRTMAVLKIAFLSSAVLELFAAIGVAGTAVYIGFSLLGSIDIGSWGTPLSLTHGLFILLLAPTFFEPLRELSGVWHDRAAGEAALDALDGLSERGMILLGASDDDGVDTVALDQAPAIRIEGLRFGHSPDRGAVFAGFDLAVQPGERVALLGSSGSGKTTLLSLIAGLAPHGGGTIRIGGEPLNAKTASRLRRRMAWIGQRPHIFAGSIRSNVSLGRKAVDKTAALGAIERMQLGAVAKAHGSAPIGEGGLGLSGGEALRLALARTAVNAHADIMLADEPTAHLDADTAAGIADALLSLAEGRTLVVATHDPILAARMDRVIRLGGLAKEAAA